MSEENATKERDRRRLSPEMRAAILEKMRRLRFDPVFAKIEEQVGAVVEKVVAASFDKRWGAGSYAQFISLPGDWFAEPPFRIEVKFGNVIRPVDYGKRLPWQHPVFEADADQIADFKAIQAKAEKIDGTLRDLTTQFNLEMDKHKSVGKLVEDWPSVKEYIPTPEELDPDAAPKTERAGEVSAKKSAEDLLKQLTQDDLLS